MCRACLCLPPAPSDAFGRLLSRHIMRLPCVHGSDATPPAFSSPDPAAHIRQREHRSGSPRPRQDNGSAPATTTRGSPRSHNTASRSPRPYQTLSARIAAEEEAAQPVADIQPSTELAPSDTLRMQAPDARTGTYAASYTYKSSRRSTRTELVTRSTARYAPLVLTVLQAAQHSLPWLPSQ